MDELIRELKRQGVLKSLRVEAAFRAIDRAGFVLPAYQAEAYANYPLPIGQGQTISQPYTVAFMLDLLNPQPGENILDIGAGSGWQTALLAHIASQGRGGKVVAIERIPELCRLARANLARYRFLERGTARLVCGDATAGLPEAAPFDKIIAAAAAGGEIPPAWREQLKPGGRIVAPVGGSVWRFTKKLDGEWRDEEFPGFAFVPLIRGTLREQQAGNRKQQSENNKQETESSERESKRRWRFLVFCLPLAAFLAAAYAFAPLRLAGRVALEVPVGAGTRAIARSLKATGLIRSPAAFVAYALLTGRAGSLKAGRYEFSGTLAIPAIVGTLANGAMDPRELAVTIPEGWDLGNIGRHFESLGLFTADEWWRAAGYPAADYRRPSAGRPRPPGFSAEFDFLAEKPRVVGLEGYLYPDTYRIFRNAAPAEVARKLLANFGRRLDPELRAQIRQSGKSIHEIITMASLLEQENPDPADRRLIAGILWRRLESGMALQVDATVNYVTGKRETPSAADLSLDSPFNTYRYPGLPPGPIANPGRDAVQAALTPTPSPYRYYLSAPDGTTIYSRTLEEHNAAKARSRRPGRADGPPIAPAEKGVLP